MDNSGYREGVLECGGGLSSLLGTVSSGILASTGVAALEDVGASVGTIASPGGWGMAPARTAAAAAARHLPAHLPDTRQLSRVTPARSSA